jgi:NADPH:quinone reductase-like Zn-dependent oxidoreductase/SAM-dependent methyltransferase/NAD(P)-dependent dehydrogenase (short-subunit alcohol dehydrogenase family)
MQEVGELYDTLIGDTLKTEPPKVQFYSTVTTQQLHHAKDFEAHYWRQNLESPVWFYQGFSNMLRSDSGKNAIVLEIGPHSALAGPIKQIYRTLNASNPYVSAMTRSSNGLLDFLSCVGELYCHGANVKYPLPRVKPKALHDLPLYPWRHAESWWSESRVMKASRFQKFPPHDLLGVRTVESSDLEPVWRNVLRLGNASWIRDHCVGPDIVFPAAGYIAIAGHAVWQMTGLDDFTVQDLSFKKAMVLDEKESSEIITRFQPHRLTDSLNSGSFEFSIQSYNGKNWTQHCTGLVVGGRHSSAPEPEMTSYSRVVDSRRWYRAMSRVGLRYGPRFVGLKGITAGVSGSSASTFVEDNKEETESPYTLHPTTIDYVLQSCLVAMHQGEPRSLQNAALPSYIEQMYVGGCIPGQSIHINTLAHDQTTDACGMAGDTLILSLKGLEFTILDSTEGEEGPEYDTVQLVWKPHLDFVDPTTLVKPAHEAELLSVNALIERMFLLCIIDVNEDIKEIPPAHPHLGVYREWMSKQLAEARNKGSPLVSDAKDLFSLSSRERKELIQDLLRSHTEGTMIPGSRILFRCYSHLSSIFKGDTEPLELMRRDGLLGQFYDCLQNKHEYATFLQLLGHLRPRMNVLEIGAGTGGLTAKILPFLQTEDGEELYQEYTYTDISSGFFVDAKERFHDCSRIRYSVLDISKDPIQQGFSVGQYDLIIASNILHATPFLSETLKNVKTLLKSDGRLLLQELCPVSNWVNFIFGLFSGWWLGKSDGRVDEPYISPAEWDIRLREAGLTGVDASALDADYPYQLNAMLIAKPACPVLEAKPVTLLCIDPSHATVESIHQHLNLNGFKVDLVKWGENLPESRDIVFLLDVEKPYFDGIGEEALAAFLHTVKEHSASSFLWVTQSAQIKPQDPRFAQVLGMARTLRSELGISFATLEMQEFGPVSQEAIREVLSKIQERTTDKAPVSEFDPDQEFAWSEGAIHVGRMQWLSVSKALEQVGGTTSAATLDISRPGLLNTLRWVAQPTRPLLCDEVRVKTMSVSMNFRELLVAMGVVPKPVGQGMVGTDSAGVVTAIGSNVKKLSIGDRVMAISVESSSYTTELQVSSRFCTRIPDNCSFEDASTLPTVYLTVLRTLREKANLRRGQTILIHSAAGGVGIAAIHYAQSVAATVYATVSSPEKVAFLIHELGVAKENIFYSRDNCFLDDVMTVTRGRGVDIVLNSLSGEQLHASWKCVAQGGSMIEIGKRDLLGRGQLAMNPFLANRSYIGVDVATLPLIEPEWVEEHMSVIVDMYEQGVIQSIHPVTSFPAREIESAFRHLQKGQHIGKLLIEFSGCPNLPLAPSKPKAEFRADGAYLLVGGMRGIGASISRWMVSNGARNVIFFSRSAGERDEDKALVRQLFDMGCQVLTFAGDVTDLETVRRVVSSAPVQIVGVLQLAMVLADTGIMDMNIERWNTAVKPKVTGTWNLHEALPSDLDFFVMTSSLSGIFGIYGQANYASANTFLDAFAQFRQSKGLAASTVDLGVVDEIGWVSQNASIHRQVVQQMSTSISEESLLDCLYLAILRSRPSKELHKQTLYGFQAQNQLLHGILSKSGVPKGQIMWKRDPRTALSRIHHEKEENGVEASETKNSGLKGFLSIVQDNPETLNDALSIEVVAREIARQVTLYTMRDVDQEVDLSLSLQNFGVDSLVSIELRNWWKQAFGADVTVLQLMNGGSLMGLGQKAVEQLKQKHLKT